MKKITFLFSLITSITFAQTDAKIYDIIDAVSADRIKADVKSLNQKKNDIIF